LLYIITTITLF